MISRSKGTAPSTQVITALQGWFYWSVAQKGNADGTKLFLDHQQVSSCALLFTIKQPHIIYWLIKESVKYSNIYLPGWVKNWLPGLRGLSYICRAKFITSCLKYLKRRMQKRSGILVLIMLESQFCVWPHIKIILCQIWPGMRLWGFKGNLCCCLQSDSFWVILFLPHIILLV